MIGHMMFVTIIASLLMMVPVGCIAAVCACSSNKAQRNVRYAEENGHVVEAALIWWDKYRQGNESIRAKYTFQYRGKTYRYTTVTHDNVPQTTLTLYFLHNPKRAGTAGDINLKQIHWVLLWLICFLLAFAWNAVRAGLS